MLSSAIFTPAPHAGSLRIFIVENHPDTLTCLRLYLAQMGHTVISAWNLEEAVAALPGADCQVLISDIGLPDGFGWDLLARACLVKPIFAIAMSGMGLTSDWKRSKAAGFRHFLLKPFDPDLLDVMLDEASRELES